MTLFTITLGSVIGISKPAAELGSLARFRAIVSANLTIRTLSSRVRSQFLAVLILCTVSSSAHALDKQASAHAGQVAGSDHGIALTGSVLAGVALVNPSYAARPDNTGHALVRFAPHIDFDLIGTRLSIPVDVNLFSD